MLQPRTLGLQAPSLDTYEQAPGKQKVGSRENPPPPCEVTSSKAEPGQILERKTKDLKSYTSSDVLFVIRLAQLQSKSPEGKGLSAVKKPEADGALTGQCAE